MKGDFHQTKPEFFSHYNMYLQLQQQIVLMMIFFSNVTHKGEKHFVNKKTTFYSISDILLTNYLRK